MAAGIQKNDPLAVLFCSPSRVKLLRFFLFNPQTVFSFEDLSRRARLVRRTARTEMNALERAGVICRRQTYEELPESDRKRKVLGYTLDPKFKYLVPLQNFFFATAPINSTTMLKHVRKVGTFDFIAAAGVFVGEFERRIDILLVSKKVSPQKVEQAIRSLEAELGIEVKYAFLDTDEFLYRIGMRDRLVRDVFDYSHHVLVDKLAVRTGMKPGQ